MSINRTRWLDKLRPAGASSGGWTEGPMAPVETTDAATVDQRCPFKHRTGWRHNHSNSKLCVALRMGQANLLSISNCHPCAGAMLSSHSILQATRFVRVILEQGSISSRKKPNLCVLSLCKPYLCIVQKKPSQILTVILAQAPCNSVQRKIRRQARHEVRTSGPALEGSIVSPLVNTMGGLSGGRRGGDVSGAASAPSLVVPGCLPELWPWIWPAESVALHTPTQELSHALTVLLHSAS